MNTSIPIKVTSLISTTITGEMPGLSSTNVFGIISVPQTLLLDKSLKNNSAGNFNAFEKNYLIYKSSFICGLNGFESLCPFKMF